MSNAKISGLPAGSPAQGTDSVPINRSGSNLAIFVSDILTAPAISNVATIEYDNIGSNFTVPTAGLVLQNTTASTGTGSQTTGQQDPPSVKFSGTFWNGAASAVGTITVWTHFSQSGGTIDGSNFYINYAGQPGNKNCWLVAYNTVAATSLQNPRVPVFALRSAYWDGSQSLEEVWQFESAMGTGANPTDTMSVLHFGSTGQATFDLTNALGTGGSMKLLIPATVASGPITPAQYTVAGLPVGVEGQTAYATNGRKVGEGAGSGTGVPVYFSNTHWRVYSTDAQVQS